MLLGIRVVSEWYVLILTVHVVVLRWSVWGIAHLVVHGKSRSFRGGAC